MERFVDQELRREFLPEYPVVVAIPVAWGDMDYFRHVNNIVFFRYFESARIAYLQRIGFDRELEQSGVGPILGATDCRFRRPVTYPDVVQVGARTTELGDDRFRMEYRLVSEAQRAVAAEGGGTLVAFDYRRNRKTQLPESVRSAIERLEHGAVRSQHGSAGSGANATP
jgi:acyl-CoA thioester hydrolase